MSDADDPRAYPISDASQEARKAPVVASADNVDRITQGLRHLNRAEQILVVSGSLFLIIGLVVAVVAISNQSFVVSAFAWFIAKVGGAMLISELIIRAARSPFPARGEKD